ncbi:MAG TPA: DUF378 domain-containing protein [Candidatus Paceibacterota bacterium]|nr:DUF378 domain-containing protein [Candidatus Paceibacterota bacterium]
MKGLHKVTFALLIIGGLNWLVFAVSGWEVGQLFGGVEALASKVIYVLVGVAAIVEFLNHKKSCSWCGKEKEEQEIDMPSPEIPE